MGLSLHVPGRCLRLLWALGWDLWATRPAVRLGGHFQHRDPVAPGEGMWPRSGALAEKSMGDEPPLDTSTLP